MSYGDEVHFFTTFDPQLVVLQMPLPKLHNHYHDGKRKKIKFSSWDKTYWKFKKHIK